MDAPGHRKSPSSKRVEAVVVCSSICFWSPCLSSWRFWAFSFLPLFLHYLQSPLVVWHSGYGGCDASCRNPGRLRKEIMLSSKTRKLSKNELTRQKAARGIAASSS